MSEAYIRFLTRKAISDPMTGLSDVPELPACLFPHQRDIVAWALRRGRSALFAGTGLGKRVKYRNASPEARAKAEGIVK